MVTACVRQYRFKPHTGSTQATAKIIVFATPAFKVLVESIDALEIFSPDAEIAAAQLVWLSRMSEKIVEAELAQSFPESSNFFRRGPTCELAACNQFGRQIFRYRLR
jgi:hypothetical protein